MTSNLDESVRIISQILSQKTVKDVVPLDKCVLQEFNPNSISQICFVNKNPFVIFLNKFLDDVLEEYSIQLDPEMSDEIYRIQRELQNLGKQLMPVLRKLMFRYYKKKLVEERGKIFSHCYPLFYRTLFLEMIQFVNDSFKKRIMSSDVVEEMMKENLTTFQGSMDDFWTRTIDGCKRDSFCYICLEPAEYYCCEWRRYCSDTCQRSSDHHLKHPHLFKNENTKVVDKRRLLDKLPWPMPDIKFPEFDELMDVDVEEGQEESTQ